MSSTKGSYLNTGDFVRIEKQRVASQGKALIGHPLTSTLHRSHKAKTRPFYFSLRLAKDLMEELEWKPMSFVNMYEGTGDHAGRIVLVPGTDSGAYKLSYTTSPELRERMGTDEYISCGVKVSISSLVHHTVTDTDKTINAQAVQHEVFGNELLVEMPNWFMPKNTRPTASLRQVIQENGEQQAMRRGPGRPRKVL